MKLNLLKKIENKEILKNFYKNNKQNLNKNIYLKKYECISIYYFCLKNNKLKENFFTGLYKKKKNSNSISKKLKLRGQFINEKINLNFFFFSPIIFKIKKLYYPII